MAGEVPFPSVFLSFFSFPWHREQCFLFFWESLVFQRPSLWVLSSSRVNWRDAVSDLWSRCMLQLLVCLFPSCAWGCGHLLGRSFFSSSFLWGLASSWYPCKFKSCPGHRNAWGKKTNSCYLLSHLLNVLIGAWLDPVEKTANASLLPYSLV